MSTLMECVLSKVRETQNEAAREEVLAMLEFEVDEAFMVNSPMIRNYF